ncbi:hypothetical protein LSAT2_001012 [Lamellibrachia satsuma]|nr:hypothetical protein LSAT2_001012 [Lamellibrachia satsuma]
MMNQQQHYNCGFCAKLDSDVLELPFTNGYTKLYVFLPCKIEGIGKLKRKISRDLIEAAISKVSSQHVDVYLPKFRYELGLPCKDMKASVGIMDGTHNLFVSRVFHHVSLEFDEGLMSSDGTHNLFVSRVFHHVSLEFDEGLMSSDGTHNLFVSRVFHHVSLEFDEGLMSSDGTHNLFVSRVFHQVSLEFDEGLMSPVGTY